MACESETNERPGTKFLAFLLDSTRNAKIFVQNLVYFN